LFSDLREIEKEQFNIKINQELIIAPLRDFIREWLNTSITKIFEIPAVEVMISNPTSSNKNIKQAATRR